MALVSDWQDLEAELPEGWVEARIDVTLEDPGADRPRGRAARPAPAASHGPGRSRSFVARGGGRAPARRRSGGRSQRLDAERLHGRISLPRSRRGAAAEAAAEPVRLPRVLGRRARDAPVRLERPARRGRARLVRLPRAGRAEPGADQPAAGREHAAPAVPEREPLRLRRLSRHGAPLPRALRRRRDPRHRHGAPRSLGLAPCRHAGPRLADRRPDGLRGLAATWAAVAAVAVADGARGRAGAEAGEHPGPRRGAEGSGIVARARSVEDCR